MFTNQKVDRTNLKLNFTQFFFISQCCTVMFIDICKYLLMFFSYRKQNNEIDSEEDLPSILPITKKSKSFIDM